MPETVAAPLRCLPRRQTTTESTVRHGMAKSEESEGMDGSVNEWKEEECLSRLNECAKMRESNARLQEGDKSTIGRKDHDGPVLVALRGALAQLSVDTEGRQMMERTIYGGRRRMIRGIGLLLLLPLPYYYCTFYPCGCIGWMDGWRRCFTESVFY